MAEWHSVTSEQGHRDEYVCKVLYREGHSKAGKAKCPSCVSVSEDESVDTTPLYQCEDCERGLLECRGCMVRHHQCLPFHRIKVRTVLWPWIGANLSVLGLEWEFLCSN